MKPDTFADLVAIIAACRGKGMAEEKIELILLRRLDLEDVIALMTA